MKRAIINSQVWLSKSFDKILPRKYRVDGNQDFLASFVPQYLGKGLIIYDVGGGKNPYLALQRKKELNATIIGVDIDRQELDRAPEGIYDKTICTDISDFKGKGEADLVICQAVLEHVPDTEKAFASIASILKPGGIALIFVPSRNALYARINLLLPQEMKKKILYSIFPNSQRDQGFPSFYDKCTPKDFLSLAQKNKLEVIEERYYYHSAYFSFFFPLYLIWRAWILAFHFFKGRQAAETFALALRKTS